MGLIFSWEIKKRGGIIVMKIKLTSNEVLSVKYILKINSAMTS